MPSNKFTKLQLAWIRDLETTRVKQTTHRLLKFNPVTKRKDGYCCLGRACVVAGVEPVYNDGKFYFDDEPYSLSNSICSKYNFRDNREMFLTTMNDTLKLSFKKIAAKIRKYPGLFFKNFDDIENFDVDNDDIEDLIND